MVVFFNFCAFALAGAIGVTMAVWSQLSVWSQSVQIVWISLGNLSPFPKYTVIGATFLVTWAIFSAIWVIGWATLDNWQD